VDVVELGSSCSRLAIETQTPPVMPMAQRSSKQVLPAKRVVRAWGANAELRTLFVPWIAGMNSAARLGTARITGAGQKRGCMQEAPTSRTPPSDAPPKKKTQSQR